MHEAITVEDKRLVPGQERVYTVQHGQVTLPPNVLRTPQTCPPLRSLCPRMHHRHVLPNHRMCQQLSCAQLNQHRPVQRSANTV